MARSAGGWLRSLSPSANPLPFGHPPSMGRGEMGYSSRFSLLPREGGRSVVPEVGFTLFRLRPTPALRASPFHRKGADGLLIPLLPPSSGRRWRVAPEVGFALFRLRPTPCPSGVPLPREGDRWSTHPASPSSGRRWRVAPEVGFALFRFQPPPCPSGIPLPWEGGRFLTASPAFLRKEAICYLNSLQRSSKTSWLGFST